MCGTFANLQEYEPKKEEVPVAGPSGSRRKEKWEVRCHSPPLQEIEHDSDSSDVTDITNARPNEEMQEMVTYVIVNYEGAHFPGLVTKLKKKSIVVSCMVKSGPDHWKWPEAKDECEYDPKDIIQVISAPTITNSRGLMMVPEVEKFWPRH